jgi:6-phosphogluconolactonase (cycloisomerase 2 family)
VKRRFLAIAFASLLIFLLLALTGCGGSASASDSDGSSSDSGGSSSGSGGDDSSGGGGGSSSSIGHLYATENPTAASIVESFAISNTGALTPLTPTVSAGNNASEIASDSNAKFVFVGNASGCCLTPSRPPQVVSYTIGTTGTLTVAAQQNLPNQSADTLSGLLVDPTGTDVYASWHQVQIEGSISSFSFDRNSGHMVLLGPDPMNTIMPGRMAITPDGKYVYASVQLRHHYPDRGGFDLFTRDTSTGVLTDTGRIFPGSRVGSDFYTDPAVALGGEYLLGMVDGTKITVWSIDSSAGDLKIASEFPGDFKGLTVTNSGTWAIATLADGTVNSYRINSDGSLAPAGSAMAAAGVTNVVVDASGKFVYVENSTAAQIFGFSLDSSTGALVTLPGSPFATTSQPIRMTTVAEK